MRDIVQHKAEEALHYVDGKEKKTFAGAPKSHAIEKWDNGYQLAEKIVTCLIDCIRQTGGAAQEGEILAQVQHWLQVHYTMLGAL